MQDVIGELDAEVARAPTRQHRVGDRVDDAEHRVLAATQAVHQRRAPLRLATAVEAVELGGDRVQLLVGVEEARGEARVGLLREGTDERMKG